MIITGGTGNGYSAKVDDENRLFTLAVTEEEYAHAAHQGNAYIWTATADWGADKNALFLRNDNTVKPLAIRGIACSPAAAAQFEIGYGTGNTVAGTTVTGSNLDLGSGKVALATGRHTNTNCDAMAGLTVLHTFWSGVTNTIVPFNGSLILGYNDEIGVGIITDVGSTTVSIFGYYVDETTH